MKCIRNILFLAILVHHCGLVLADIDLFFDKRYRRFTSEGAENCDNVCAEGDGCLLQVSWIMEGVCYPSTGGDRAYKLSLVTPTEVCRARYSDSGCQLLKDNNPCPGGSKTIGGVCHEFGEIYHFKDFCINSPEGPRGEYTTPMVELLSFPSQQECIDKTPTFGRFFWPNDPSVCIQSAVAKSDADGTRLPGSVRSYCDSTGRFRQEDFSDRTCGSNDGVLEPAEIWTTDCSTMDLSTRTWGYADCQATPQYYCKDFRLVSGQDTSSGNTAVTFVSMSWMMIVSTALAGALWLDV